MKATEGERFAAKFNYVPIELAKHSRLAREVDSLLARERAKVAEDVLAMADDVAQTRDELVAKVRAKYGKVRR